MKGCHKQGKWPPHIVCKLIHYGLWAVWVELFIAPTYCTVIQHFTYRVLPPWNVLVLIRQPSKTCMTWPFMYIVQKQQHQQHMGDWIIDQLDHFMRVWRIKLTLFHNFQKPLFFLLEKNATPEISNQNEQHFQTFLFQGHWTVNPRNTRRYLGTLFKFESQSITGHNTHIQWCLLELLWEVGKTTDPRGNQYAKLRIKYLDQFFLLKPF